MTKKIFILLFSLLILTGCNSKIKQDDNIERIYLSNKYYDKGEYIKVKKEDLISLNEDAYLLFTYNNYCTLPIPCEEVFEEFMKLYHINIISMPYSEFKDTEYANTVKYAPSILIIKNNNILAYLDAESDEDLIKYQDSKEFAKWLDKYIYFEKSK